MNKKVEDTIGMVLAIPIITFLLAVIFIIALVDVLTFRKFNLIAKHKNWLLPKLSKLANQEKGGEDASKE